jgi:hypothetical protein
MPVTRTSACLGCRSHSRGNRDVAEGNWAVAGRTISLANIADSVGLLKTGSRFAWSKAYFAAKERAPPPAIPPMKADPSWTRQAEDALLVWRPTLQKRSVHVDAEVSLNAPNVMVSLNP